MCLQCRQDLTVAWYLYCIQTLNLFPNLNISLKGYYDTTLIKQQNTVNICVYTGVHKTSFQTSALEPLLTHVDLLHFKQEIFN